MSFKRFGVMLDCSRNAVMKVSEIKKLIDYLVKMGYNALELYTEDTLEVENEPYFGYMRGRYTGEEIRSIDEYAHSKGVELIPCIQTLAHFTNTVKLPAYADIVDVNDILLIDEPKTYEFLENIFSTLAKNFTSRQVNIGMDEAHMVGLGKYLDKHGYCNRFDVLLRHLNKVVQIAKKYGFTPHMWSDMFFRLANNGDYYASNNSSFKQLQEKIPNEVELTYWDYYHHDKKVYDNMIAGHKLLERPIWFAGGAWSWCGFAPLNKFTLSTMQPAMQSVIENKIENVLITMWGDNGKECSFFALLPSLYAIRRFADGQTDMQVIKQEFNKLFNLNFDDFMLLDEPNAIPVKKEAVTIENPCKCLLYTDCFVNSFDCCYKDKNQIDYAKISADLQAASASAGEFSYLFTELASLCKVLEIKGTLSKKTRQAYENGNKNELQLIANELDELTIRLQNFHEQFYLLWHKENKTFGWEVHDARLGGLIQRVKTCKRRLTDYINGKMQSIEELEQELLSLGDDWWFNNQYARLVSSSEI
ncbi:MAG: beta-N-acetylhexosaminidase [Clostridia bacterium]|nr:beta-N-acetylhexosaminidase [Clostridia bacterium]